MLATEGQRIALAFIIWVFIVLLGGAGIQSKKPLLATLGLGTIMVACTVLSGIVVLAIWPGALGVITATGNYTQHKTNSLLWFTIAIVVICFGYLGVLRILKKPFNRSEFTMLVIGLLLGGVLEIINLATL